VHISQKNTGKMEQTFQVLAKNVRDTLREGNEESTRAVEFAYKVDGIWYSSNFPISYTLEHDEGTGPGMCDQCYDTGMNEWGAFVSYCAECARYYDEQDDDASTEVSSVEEESEKSKKNVFANIKIKKEPGVCLTDDCPYLAASQSEYCDCHWKMEYEVDDLMSPWYEEL